MNDTSRRQADKLHRITYLIGYLECSYNREIIGLKSIFSVLYEILQ